MHSKPDPLDQLSEIKNMMEKSSRFLSLSGLSGVSAGIVALVGACLAYLEMGNTPSYDLHQGTIENVTGSKLFLIAIGTLGSALVFIFLFTYRKSRQLKLPVWNHATKRLIINLAIPLVAGGLFILKIADLGYLGLIAPACLIFYGLSMVNASKYTLGDIRALGIIEIGLGLVNLLFIDEGLMFWTLGFGIAHILYGIYLWNKYDKH